MKLHVKKEGDPILRAKAQKVGQITDEIRTLISDMIETMFAAGGIGLAAPQVGVLLRIIVASVSSDRPPMTLINPEITISGPLTSLEEGCLSIPGLRKVISRPSTVDVVALNERGNKVAFRVEGLLAKVIQHEVDHLDGILIIDK